LQKKKKKTTKTKHRQKAIIRAQMFTDTPTPGNWAAFTKSAVKWVRFNVEFCQELFSVSFSIIFFFVTFFLP
jgi:hypothetical protein